MFYIMVSDRRNSFDIVCLCVGVPVCSSSGRISGSLSKVIGQQRSANWFLFANESVLPT